MSWRFRKVFSGGPFRGTLSRSGIGWSFGIPGLRYGVAANGRRYISCGVPGLGLYWMKYLDDEPREGVVPSDPPGEDNGPAPATEQPARRQVWRRPRR